ncbi:MAG: chromosomal replication initiator protein DnaA [Longimicrobiales bacterium]|nr:chromosomal replication initiator protein DnaA [Longimicrobiales bacterium]
MEFTAEELWSKVLENARTQIQGQTYRTWLADTSAKSLTDSGLIVEVASQFHVEWISEKYGKVLTEVAQGVVGRTLTLQFHPRSPSSPLAILEPEPEEMPSLFSPQNLNSSPSGKPALNEKYLFSRFVVGNDNQLASAACKAVASNPSRMYNPLFLYGGVGLGKTHLMHAIGNEVLSNNRLAKVAYVTTEKFTNELIMAIRDGSTANFRARYREKDLLLVDDVQFLKGKERTQEEFFHTFNTLYDAHKQVVLTSDRPPKEIPGLEERLISRFAWGLVTDIMPPDYETRLAILKKKSEDEGLDLDEGVSDFIARSCTSSIRELEGALIKLMAFASVANKSISVDLARTALRGTFGYGPGSAGGLLTPEMIRQTVALRWRVSEEALASKRRSKDLAVPRQVAMYLIKTLLDYPLVAIGRVFGDRDHSTVIHSIKKVEQTLEKDSTFRRIVEAVQDELKEK